MNIMKIRVLACSVLARELCLAAVRTRENVDLEFLPQGLHCEPDLLRQELQQAIDRIEEKRASPRARFERMKDMRDDSDYDALVLGYGLCSNGVAGIKSHRFPLVVPRAHDCITLLLGSKERYAEYFATHEGIYWYSAGWIEKSVQPGPERHRRMREYYVEKYGQDNADYLMEMEQGWMQKYKWAIYVDMGLPLADYYREYTKTCAEFLGWNFKEVAGHLGLIEAMLSGNWDTGRFLVVPPGQTIVPSYDDAILGATAEDVGNRAW